VHLPLYVPERFTRESRNGRYGAAVAAIDWAAGMLLAELRALGLDDDTIVIFTSDNGSRAGDEGGSNLPLRGTKGTTWEGGMRVPCLARWPGRVPAATCSAVLTTAMDLLPTLARVAGASVTADRAIDGRDILPVLLGETDRSPHDAFFYYYACDLEAVRVGRWKLHLAKHRQPVEELYDLVDDVGETRDVGVEHPDVVASLLAHAERARAELGDERLGRKGTGVRAIGEVERGEFLTTYDPAHPYYLAEYDLADRG
jgi:arylsulfatase A-like enzyme